MSGRSTSIITVSALLLLALVHLALAQPGVKKQESERSQKEVYAEAVKLYEQQRYREAIESFQQAHRQNPLPGILLNIANAYRHLAQQQPHDRSFTEQALAHFDRYLREERGTIHCEIMRQRAEVERLRNEPPADSSPASLAIASSAALHDAYVQNHNPDIMRCLAGAQLSYAKSLSPSSPRSEQSERSLRSFQEYFREAAAQKRPTDPLAANERAEAQALFDASSVVPTVEPRTAGNPLPRRRKWLGGLIGTLSTLAVAGIVVGAVLGTRPHPVDAPAGSIEIPASTPWMTVSLPH